ncbi:MAG: DUF2971 domain-containing protein [Rickettsiales bacterium]|nr:MAG: DUF2971 domain-containing protein [Rickettsiales bacterium]
MQDFVKKSQEFYPGLRFSRSYSMYSSPEPTSCDFEYSFSNGFLKGSPYELSSDTQLIHYIPSIEILFEIIKSGVFRLTSLNAKNDKYELSYLTKQLKVNIADDIIEKYKKQFFCASFGKVYPNNEEEFTMWRLYGAEGRGAALIFKVENNIEDWHRFTIGQVKYGLNEASERYREFVSFFNDFQKFNNNPIQNQPITYTAFLALHKNIGWEYENEIRILIYYKYDDYTYKTGIGSDLLTKVYHSYNNNSGHYAYIELPLVGSVEYERLNSLFLKDDMNDLHSGFLSMLPRLKLEKIILGYQYSPENLLKISNTISHEIAKHPTLRTIIYTSKFSDH